MLETDLFSCRIKVKQHRNSPTPHEGTIGHIATRCLTLRRSFPPPYPSWMHKCNKNVISVLCDLQCCGFTGISQEQLDSALYWLQSCFPNFQGKKKHCTWSFLMCPSLTQTDGNVIPWTLAHQSITKLQSRKSPATNKSGWFCVVKEWQEGGLYEALTRRCGELHFVFCCIFAFAGFMIRFSQPLALAFHVMWHHCFDVAKNHHAPGAAGLIWH